MSKKAKRYLLHLRILSKNPLAADTATLYISSLVSSGVGFISSVIVARTLGPTEFAVIAGYNAIVLTLAGFTDFGLGTGLIKYTTPHLKDKGNIKEAAPYFKAVFIMELVIGSLLLSLGLLFASFIPKLLGQNISIDVIRIAIVAASITSAGAYVGAALAAHKKFKLNAVISITISLLKLLFVVVLLYFSNISVVNILIGYVLLSFLNTALGFIFTPKDYLTNLPYDSLKKASKSILSFSGWLTLSFFMTSVMGKLDFFNLYRIKGPTEAGVYAAAQQLSMLYSILLGAISTVMTSYISEKIQYSDKVRFLKKAIPTSLLLAGLFVLSSIAAPVVLELIFGSKYSGAVIPLQILIGSMAVSAALIPISLMFIPLGKVKYGTFIVVLQLVIAITLYPILIERWGAAGAALTVLITSIAALIIYPVILVLLLKKENKNG